MAELFKGFFTEHDKNVQNFIPLLLHKALPQRIT